MANPVLVNKHEGILAPTSLLVFTHRLNHMLDLFSLFSLLSLPLFASLASHAFALDPRSTPHQHLSILRRRRHDALRRDQIGASSAVAGEVPALPA